MALKNYEDKFISLSNLRKFWEGVSGKISAVDAKFTGYYTKGEVDGIKSALQKEIDDDVKAASDALQANINLKADITALNDVDAKFAGYYTKEDADDMDAAVRAAFAAADADLKSELLGEIGKLTHLSVQVVDVLPSEGVSGVIYLVADVNAYGTYIEHIWTGSAFEQIGSTKTDLSDYYTKSQVDGIKSGLEGDIADAKAAAEATAAGALSAYKTEVSNEFSTVRGEITSAQNTLQGNIDKKLDKSEFNTTIAGYYTKGEVDSALELKANSADVYTKTEVNGIITGLGDTYYTEAEINDIVDGLEGAIELKLDKATYDGVIGTLATKTEVNSAVGAVAGNLETLADKVEALEVTGGQANVIEVVKVNGEALTPEAKTVNINLEPYAKAADVYTTTEVDGFVTTLDGKISGHVSAVETWAASIAFATDSDIEGIFA